MNKIHLRIGSSADNDVIIESGDVAPHHLELFCDAEGNVFITDLGSEQGTYINQYRLDGFKLLKKGDRVRFGTSYYFLWEEHLLPKSEPTALYHIEEDEEEMDVQASPSKNKEESNKQLYLIYGCIILLIILMSLYL